MTQPGALIPVSVIGGYLGAGKTTMVNHLLGAAHGRRLAVLVNDFGAVNVDAGLITARDGDTISLENGCVCCSIGDALGDAIDQVLTMDPRPDQIVIEASGVADPAKVAIYGQGWPGCRLDAVVVLVDVETIRQRAVDRFVGSTVVRQLRSADLIVMTKTDLIDDTQLEQVRGWLRGQAPGRALLAAESGAIEPQAVLDVGADTARLQGHPAAKNQLAADHPAAEQPAAEQPAADDVFEAVHLDQSTLGTALDRGALERALELWPAEAVRIKGTVALSPSSSSSSSSSVSSSPDDGSAGCQLVQRVGTRWTIEPAAHGIEPTGLVFILLKGHLDRADLLKVLGARSA